MTKTATLWTNPAKNPSETVTVVRKGTKANGFEGWTRVQDAQGHTFWTSNRELRFH